MFPLSTCATAFGVAHAPNPPLRYLSRCRYLYRPPAYPWRASGLSRCRHRCQPPAHPWRASGPSRCWHRCRPPAHPRRASGPEPPSLEHVRAEGQPFAKKNRGGSRLAGIPLLFLANGWRSAMHGINRRRLRTLWNGEPEALQPPIPMHISYLHGAPAAPQSATSRAISTGEPGGADRPPPGANPQATKGELVR